MTARGRKPCSVKGCPKLAHARTMCPDHYAAWYKKNRGKVSLAPKAPNHQPLTERLWSRTVVDEFTGCWTLNLAVTRQSAVIRVNGKQMAVHRAAWEALRGPIPAGLVIDHLCRNPKCWNPDHLEPVTQRINLLWGHGPVGKYARANRNCRCWDIESTVCPAHGVIRYWLEEATA